MKDARPDGTSPAAGHFLPLFSRVGEFAVYPMKHFRIGAPVVTCREMERQGKPGG